MWVYCVQTLLYHIFALMDYFFANFLSWQIWDSIPGPLRFIRLRISGGVTSKNERQRSVDTSLSSTVLSAARVNVAPQRCLIGLPTKVLSLLYVLCVYTGYFSEPTFFRVSSTLFFTSSLSSLLTTSTFSCIIYWAYSKFSLECLCANFILPEFLEYVSSFSRNFFEFANDIIPYRFFPRKPYLFSIHEGIDYNSFIMRCSGDDLVLKRRVQRHEVLRKARDAHAETLVSVGVDLRVQQILS